MKMNRIQTFLLDLAVTVAGLNLAYSAVTEDIPFLFGIGVALGAIGAMECADQVKEARRP